MLTDNIVYVAAGLVAWRVWDWLDGLVRGKVSEWRRWRKRTRTKQHDKPAASYRIAREPNFPGFTEVNINGTRRIVPDEPSAIRYHIHFHCDGELTFATLRDSVRRLREQKRQTRPVRILQCACARGCCICPDVQPCMDLRCKIFRPNDNCSE